MINKMDNVSFASLKLKNDNRYFTFDFGDKKIEVKNYLGIDEKYDLIMIALQKADENGYCNPIKVKMYFDLYLVYMYTNITFTQKQKEDEVKLYDLLKSSGIIDKVKFTMNDVELNYLRAILREIMEYKQKYSMSAAAVVNSFIQDLPRNAQTAKEIIDSFDKEKFGEVLNFAEAANGGRPILGNKE